MAGPLSSANREIREAEAREHARKLGMLRRPRLLADRLLAQLEELNLDDVTVVPSHLGPSIDELRASVRAWPQVEARLGTRLRPGVRTSDLIDTVFAVQEILSPAVTEREPPDLDDYVLFQANQVRR